MKTASILPLVAAVAGTFMLAGCADHPVTGTTSLAATASDVFDAPFGSTPAARTGTCMSAQDPAEADGRPYQHTVGQFLLAHFGAWGKHTSLTPGGDAGADPTGLAKAFGNPDLGRLIQDKLDAKGQDSIPQTPTQMTADGIRTLLAATALMHHHGDFLHMAMEVDCGWRTGAEKLLAAHFPATTPALSQLAARKWLVRVLVYDAAYFNAYIRNGQFGTVNIDTTELTAKLQALSSGNAALAALLPQIQSVIDSGGAASLQPFGKIGTAGFVDVFGNKYQIQAIQAQIGEDKRIVTVSHIDYPAAEAGLIRVFLEALFDASDRVPAVPIATGAPAGLKTELSDLGVNMNDPGAEQLVAAVALPVITSTAGGGGSAVGVSFTGDDVSRIEKGANNAETAASAVVEAFPEGFAGFSPSPALRTLLQTAVGVTARKAAEDIGWARLGYHPPS